MSLAQQIKHKAQQLHFDIVGITDASPINSRQVEFFAEWLKSGHAGQMGYLHKNFEKRLHPARLMKDAQSVIIVGLNYKPARQNAKNLLTTDPMGKVANYAQYEDYHLFIKRQLRKLTDFICLIAGEDHKFKLCVDSAPLAERALAVRAGLGFIGKNHMLTNPLLGPELLLGEIITTVQLQPDKPITDDCSKCDRCLVACPTGALSSDGQFDASKCISYLTIEYKGQVPANLAEKIGGWLFGCDECVVACPYQEKAPACRNKQFKFYPDRARLNLRCILNLTPQEFDFQFGDSPLKRLGLKRLKRNAQICLANITGPHVQK